MIETVREKVRRLFLDDSALASRDGKVFDVRDVAYFCSDQGTVRAHIDDETSYVVDRTLSEIEEIFRGLFIRTYRYYLVNVKRIAGISRRYPTGKDLEELQQALAAEPARAPELEKERAEDECELHLAGCSDTVPVTSTYAGAVRELLGISTFAHLVPDHPEDRRLRELGIIDFAWRELGRLDPANEAAVTAYMDLWNLGKFDKPRLMKYFRRITSEEIDKRKFILNIIWQLYRWYGQGIDEPMGRSIRNFWYEKVKPALGHHGDLLGPHDDDIFYDVLEKMILRERLFKYRDFEFEDVAMDQRAIGDKHPEIILEAEKNTYMRFQENMQKEYGITYICHEGAPGNISLEYFADELRPAVGGRPLAILTLSDLNPGGFYIERFFLERLQWYGYELEPVHRLMDLSEEAFPDQSEIYYRRTPVAKYKRTAGGKISPVEPYTMGQVTKAINWHEDVMMSTHWLYTEEEYQDVDGSPIFYCTIWGVDSDAPERKDIEKRFRRVMAELGVEPIPTLEA